MNRQTFQLPPKLHAAVSEELQAWERGKKSKRLWDRDASLWTGTDEGNWLGWLDVVATQQQKIDHLLKIGEEASRMGFRHALLLGMGGSSLCPEVMSRTFARAAGHPELRILDSTDPAQIRTREKEIGSPESTLFIVSSKSGSTLEPNIFQQYFYERARQAEANPGDRFIAITDPGSRMQKVAEGEAFRHVFFGVPEIGGRYSALSDFGMVPAAIEGLDMRRFLACTTQMVEACGPAIPAPENPGVTLGAILGVLAGQGRDKVTLIASPRIEDLGAWLEQLLAESTGKSGKGLIPVDREQPGAPQVYGSDRVFAYLRLSSAPDAAQDRAIEALENAGEPVVRISVEDVYNLGQEFFRWEIATAVAGSIIGINAFNQPDVEASKVATRALTDEYERKGKLPAEAPFFQSDGMQLFADARNVAELQGGGGGASISAFLRRHFERLKPGDYFAALAYIERNGVHQTKLQAIRHRLRDERRVATCLGFGPRFLHSTGQAYKGGPNTGVFLQITCEDAEDLPVPGQKYTFGVVKAAQARGDFQVLAERGRRALRVHLGRDVNAGLEQLASAVDQALR